MAEQGRRIADRYELLTLLGRGGMGVVWRARDGRLGRAVAVKLLSATSVGSAVARARLIREARAAAALEHDGIIRVYDVGETDDGGAFLVMELIRGRSLREALRADTPSLARRARVIVDAARALAFAHAAGIVHRDVKPDNIMMRDDGRVTLVDFGVAKPVSRELITNAETLAGVTEKSLTGANELVGTPKYLAPEQARGGEVTAAADQFALAVTAYEALCGKTPWKGAGIVEIVAAILRDPIPPISSCAAVPADLDAVLGRALAKEPEQRWADMNAFADAFQEAAASLPPEPAALPSARGRPHGSTPPTSYTALPSSAPRPSPSPSPSPSTHSGQIAPASAASRHGARARAAVAMGAGALAIALGGWLAFHARAPTGAGTRSSGAPVSAASAREAEVYACPAFEVVGMDEPWLGAAAAALACERFQIARGGLDARTLVPAEIAGVPREVVQSFPTDSLDDAGPRERATAAAKQRASRWLDGRLEKQLSGFVVSVVLRASDDAEIARGEGKGIELFEAVSDALKPVVAAMGPPTAQESALLRDWLDVTSAAEGLDLLDVRTAILVEDPIALKEACAMVAQRPDVAARVAYFTRLTCARRLRTGKLADPPPPLDESSPGRLITTALARGTTGGPDEVRARAARLEHAREQTSLAEGQARLSAAAAELYHLIGDPRARQLARMAVQASPKAFDWRTSSWHRLAFTSDPDPALSAALSTWHPWEPVAHVLRGGGPGHLGDPMNAEKYVRRAYLLAQRGYFANGYGELLLSQGKIESARGIAELTRDDLLRVQILLAEAKYGAALTAVVQRLAALPSNEESAALAFELTSQGVKAAVTLGRSPDFVDGVVTRYVMSEPHHVIDGVVPFVALVSACCLAPRPTGKRCLQRLDRLWTDGQLPSMFVGAGTVIAGGLRFVADDYAGAARSWRTLLRSPGWIQEPLREAMAVAFEHAGATELAEEVDAPSLALVDLAGTAELSWVRGARRAHAKGDDARARKLAQAVVDRWRFADEDVPAMAEMKQLLAKLPR